MVDGESQQDAAPTGVIISRRKSTFQVRLKAKSYPGGFE
jgi:hypothetical protein